MPENVQKDVQKDVQKELTDKQRDIYDYLRQNPSASLAEMSKKLKVSSKTIQRNLDILKEKGLVERVGGKKSGQWIVKDLTSPHVCSLTP